MLRESAAVDYDFISAPYNKIIVVREDGTAAVLLHDRAVGISAWSRVSLGTGKIISCATAPGNNGYDDIYFAVTNEGGTWLERIEEEAKCWTDGWKEGAGGAADITEARPYTAIMASMPVIAEAPDAKKRVVSLVIRLLESGLPLVKSIPERYREVITGVETPCSGLVKVPVPSGYNRDVQFELSHDKNEPCQILAVNAEVQ
jgi:hypothetical protein